MGPPQASELGVRFSSYGLLLELDLVELPLQPQQIPTQLQQLRIQLRGLPNPHVLLDALDPLLNELDLFLDALDHALVQQAPLLRLALPASGFFASPLVGHQRGHVLGPGLLESTYAECLKRELRERRLRYVSELSIPVVYKGATLDLSYRIDLIVEDRVVVEVKSVATVLPVHEAQLLTYLKLTACPIGLLINFNEAGNPSGQTLIGGAVPGAGVVSSVPTACQ